MWVVVFVMFVGNEYRIQPLPYIYFTKEQCEVARNNNDVILDQSRPEGGFYISRCVDMGTQT